MGEKHLIVSGLQLWQWRNAALEAAIATDVPIIEVDWLLLEVAGLDRLALRLESFKNWPQIQLQLPLEKLDQLWQRRLNDRLPVQYIAGVTPWRNFQISVSSAVLIPRPETESLIDLALAAASGVSGHWADLGTGSGAIAIGLADVLPKATIHAVDYSLEALAIARTNAANLGFVDRIKFYQGSWWEPLAFLKGQFSGMVSNPPYIPTSTLPTLQPEVVNHEPHLALDGGGDGLDCIRHLIEISPSYLQSGGVWLIEMMAGQADAVRELLQNQGSYCKIQIHADLAGIERFALAYKS
ncbi:peptide chain release factor N(5)-glutamine methyltransferase [Nostoc sp. UCD121]|uniref:peptide chain release factor N(5)-glutamine methyltransferase n=1 Tax=unclassified Nostoc TaxID=2593658 RepID=UPI0016288941|nr:MULTISPECIES: peptide chain release factor N(5)-glutamine methyltransferase [unclassified Nostoc]MBC1222809.1 peptide chain release factor N(5)-glutamine methyltransferase [Nostoc sp. UCD120]MBC1275653.1 peptide chain release factor N(5)-glutamine methyltransferase [Nostoc sp. UCD121]MBC1294769.1 peptide chain release factor N(5)-glutamine methyltransferase [Nostoc sp. UCD122]